MLSTSRLYRAARTLGATCVVLAGTLGLAAPSVARADNSIEQQITKLLGQARSYEAMVTIKESGAGVSPGASSFQMDEIMVRRGRVTAWYTRITAGGQTVEMVLQGSKICMRPAGRWRCEDGGPQYASLLKETPEQSLKSLGLHVVFKPAGAKVIAGQPAVGYTFTATSSSATETGTFWLDRPRQRVVAMDAVTIDKAAGKRSTLSMRAVFTHWNDPTLKIPAIPGL